MAQSGDRDGSRAHPHIARWPSRRSDLVDTTVCPACFEPLRTAVCDYCALNLRHPAAAEVLAASDAVIAALDSRAEIIVRIRTETDAAALAERVSRERLSAERAAAERATAERRRSEQLAVSLYPELSVAQGDTVYPTYPDPGATPGTSPVERAATHTPPPRTTPRVEPVETSGPARRVSSVQLALLIAGISLLSVFAIFFLVYAFINYGIVWRSVIIGAITVAAFVTATLLQRRDLRATAEGIGVFAIVLVYLDAFAIRANDLFGAESLDGPLYWGITLVVAACAFLLWHRRSRLRAPSLVGFATLAPGAGTIAFGLTGALGDGERTAVVFAVIALAGVVHRFAGVSMQNGTGHSGVVERSVVLVTTVVSLAAATVVAFLLEPRGADLTASVLGLLAVAVIATLHLAVLHSLPDVSTAWAGAIAVPLGLATALLGVAVWVHTAQAAAALPFPLLVSASAALAFDSASRRGRVPLARTAGRSAAIASLVVLVSAMLIPIVSAASVVVRGLFVAVDDAWTFDPLDRLFDVVLADLLIVVALAGVGLLAALAWRLDGLLPKRMPLLAWYSAAVLLLAAPLTATAAGTMGVRLAMSAGALVAAVLGGSGVRRIRIPLVALYAASLVLGWSVAWASQSTWPVAAGAVVLLIAGGRWLVTAPVGRSAFLAGSSVMLLVAAATTVRQLGYASDPETAVWTLDAVRAVTLLAAVVVIVASLIGRRVTTLDRRMLFWLHAGVAAVGAVVIRSSVPSLEGLFDENAVSIVIAALLLVAVLAWVAPPWTADFRVERIAASAALAPVSWLLLDSIVRATGLAVPTALAPAVAALTVAVVSLVLHARSATGTPRNWRELGVAVTALGSLVVGAGSSDALDWVPLALVALTAAVSAVGQRQEPLAAVGFGTAALLATIAAGSGGDSLARAADATGWLLFDGLSFAGFAAIALLGVAALRLEPVVPAVARRTVFWVALAVAGTTQAILLAFSSGGVLLDRDLSGVVAHVLLVAALLLWTLLPSARDLRPERIVASIAIGPVIYLVVDSFVRVIDAPELARAVAPVTAALMSAAGSLAVAVLRRPRLDPDAASPAVASAAEPERGVTTGSGIPRGLREIGVALVGAPALIVAGLDPDGATWLVLLIAAVTLLVLAVSADGLFASASWRRHFGWGAIVLAAAGLWWRLSNDSVGAVEPYVLPVAGLLLLVALLLWRAARRAGSASLASPLVALGGLLVGLLPVAAVAAEGRPARALVVGGISVALLLAGTLVPARAVTSQPASTLDSASPTPGRSRTGGIRPYLDIAALAGALGVLVTAGGRAWSLVWTRPGSLELDAWLGAGVAVLIIAAFGITHRDGDRFSRQRDLGARAVAVIALSGATLVEAVVIARTEGSLLRPLAVVLLLSAVHVIAFIIDRVPLDRPVAWLAVAYAAVIAAVGLGTGALDPVEAGSIPIALALIASGVMRLDESERPRSWPWLGPGVIVLLLPSLIATIDDRPLWRLVGIGVVGVAVVIASVNQRLQAPFVIATVLVVVHGIATFAPQIRGVYESVAWWLWLGIGGLLLTVLAARYEQRLTNVRDVVERIGSLR